MSKSQSPPQDVADFLHEFNAACVEVGIDAKALERAWEGRFIPYGAMGDEAKWLTPVQNCQLYEADEHDTRRDNIRKLVIGVADKTARTRLMEKYLAVEQQRAGLWDNDRREKAREIQQAHKAIVRANLLWPAMLGTASVAVGYFFFSLPGAIGGAVTGLFLGQGVAHIIRGQADRNLRSLTEELIDIESSAHSEELMPPYFSRSERTSGEEDKSFGGESAFDNHMTFFKQTGEKGA